MKRNDYLTPEGVREHELRANIISVAVDSLIQDQTISNIHIPPEALRELIPLYVQPQEPVLKALADQNNGVSHEYKISGSVNISALKLGKSRALERLIVCEVVDPENPKVVQVMFDVKINRGRLNFLNQKGESCKIPDYELLLAILNAPPKTNFSETSESTTQNAL